ncbi:MAG TPA: hypothetical protein VFE59_10740 [Trebonia sp.]|jgi:hypothetical protein|nr:hypothetical protein [Trebonia sp.]
MSDESWPSPAHQPPVDELTAAAYLRVVLLPAAVASSMAAEKVAELPKAARADYPDPSASAHMVIKSVPVTVEATGSVPASDAPAVFATLGITAVGMTGIMGALMTAYVAAGHAPASVLPWFVGLALGQLALALAVIIRIGRRAHKVHPRTEADHAAPQRAPAAAPSPE